MTRQEIRRRAAVLCGEVFGTPGHDNPVNWDLWIDTATDDITRVVGAYYQTVTANVVSGTSRYCAPELYHIDSVSYIDDNGDTIELVPGTPLDLSKTASGWQNVPASIPQRYATRGLRDIVLYPTPNYDRTDGLVFEGFVTPGSAGAGGSSRWPLPTNQCPLPIRAHVGVMWRTAYYRMVENNGDVNRMALFDREFKTQKGYLEREAATFTAANQHRDTPDYGSIAPVFDPLDLGW